MTSEHTPYYVDLPPDHETSGPFRTFEIGLSGVAQISEALELTKELEGDTLDDALMDHFGRLAARGELHGVAAIAEWACGEETQNEAAMIIRPIAGVETMSDEDRYRVGVAQTALIAHTLGTPWSRHYENHGQRIQHVKPDPGHLQVEGSIGAAPLWPHNEILPTIEGKIICSEFSTLYAVHNTDSGTPTTLYDAPRAIASLSPETLEVLRQPRFKYLGTFIEQEDSESDHTPKPPLQILYSLTNEAGEVTGYDLIADLDDQTMLGVDDRANEALHELRSAMMEQELEYTILDGSMLVWRNRKALHGRRPVTDMERHLVRSQVGEAEYSEHPPTAAE